MKFTYKNYTSDGSLKECVYEGKTFAIIGKVSAGNWRGNLIMNQNIVLARTRKAELVSDLYKEYLKLL